VQQTTRYDVDRMVQDAAQRGWMPIDLIRAADVSIAHGYRFLRQESASPRTAEKFTRALGKRQGFYLIKREAMTA
jgi:hypothetical protein